MEKFLSRPHIIKTEEEYLERLTTTKEIKLVIEALPTKPSKNNLGPNCFTGEFYQILKK